MDKFIKDFLYEVSDVSNFLDYKMISKIILSLKKLKKKKVEFFSLVLEEVQEMHLTLLMISEKFVILNVILQLIMYLN